MGPSHCTPVGFEKARPAWPLDHSNQDAKSGCHEVSWGGGCFPGCFFTAYGYGKTQQAHVNVYMDRQLVPTTVKYCKPDGFGPARPPEIAQITTLHKIRVS